MKLSTSLVAIKKITSNTPRSIFADDDLEKAAQLILDSEGVINPILVRRNGLQSYEVVDGYFEYYAAARAREIDPRKGEMIGVFIIEPENEEQLTKQVQLFRKQKDETSGKLNLTPEDLEKFLNNLESRLDKLAKQLLDESSAKVKLENENKDIRKLLDEKVEPLKLFQEFSANKLLKKLIIAGFDAKKAAQIAEIVIKEREKEQFKSLHDVIDRVKIIRGKKMQKQKGISEKKMIDIIEVIYHKD